MAKKKEDVVKVTAEKEDDAALVVDPIDSLVASIISRVEKSKDVMRSAHKHLAFIKRDIGEDLLRYSLPDKKTKPLSKMTLTERRVFREGIGAFDKKKMTELSNKLNEYSVTSGIMSPKFLYETMRMAVELSEADIKRAVDDYGANSSILLLLTRAENEDDRWKVLDKAKAAGKMSVQDFTSLLQELTPEELPLRPDAAKAINAGETKRKEKQHRVTGGKVHEMDVENEDKKGMRKEAAAERKAIFNNSKSLANVFSNMTAHLEDVFESQLSNIWTAVADEIRELDEKPRIAAYEKLDPLMTHIKVVRDTCDKIMDSYKEYKEWESNQPKEKKGKK